MTYCEAAGYKVGDWFEVIGGLAFDVGAIIQLYRDDGTDCPLFSGKTSYGYTAADGQPGAYTSLSLIKKIAEEPKQMFNIKTDPWFIRVNNKQEFEALEEWLEENYGSRLGLAYQDYFTFLTNVSSDGNKCSYAKVMYASSDKYVFKDCKEIKLTFKTVVESVEYPIVETEQQIKIKQLQETIDKACKEIKELREMGEK